MTTTIRRGKKWCEIVDVGHDPAPRTKDPPMALPHEGCRAAVRLAGSATALQRSVRAWPIEN